MALDYANAGQLPNPPPQYDQQHLRQMIRVLEIYFSQLDSNMPNHSDKYTAREFVGELFTTVALAAAQATINTLSAQNLSADHINAKSVSTELLAAGALNAREMTADTLTVGDVYANFLRGDGRYVVTPFNMLTSSLDQAAANTNTAFVLAMDNILEDNSISLVAGTQITVADAGIYSFNYTLQLRNTANSIDFADVWLRRNGVNVVGSNTRFAVRGSGPTDGWTTGVQDFVLRLAPGDYVELVWHVTALSVAVRALPAVAASGTTPAIPSSPSVIVVVRLITAEFPPVLRVAPTSVSGFTSLGSVTVSTPRRPR